MQPGDVIDDRYEVGDLIGRGGMGRVHRGVDLVLGRPVALKFLTDRLTADTASVDRILTEARLAAKVRHPNVVQVLDAVVGPAAAPVVVLELIDGPSLASRLRTAGSMPLEQVRDLVGQIAAGLAAAHAADLVHRDVSPANILLDGTVARLTDFGIARSMTTAHTLTGTVRGSVAYVAPEQVTGADVGPAADVYALACVAFAALTGHPPFEAEEQVGVVHQHLTSPPPDVRALRPDVPVDVAIALQAAMAKDAARRIPTPGGLAAALARPLEDDDTTVVVTSSPTQVPGDDATMSWHVDDVASPSTADEVATAVAEVDTGGGAQVVESGDGTRLVVVGRTRAEGTTAARHDPTRRRGMSHRWLGIGAAAAVAVAVAAGQLTDLGSGFMAVAGAAQTQGVEGATVGDPVIEDLEDALLRVRGTLIRLEEEDRVAGDAGSAIDDALSRALDAARDARPDAVHRGIERVHTVIDREVADERVSGEAEIELLEGLLEADEALDALQARATGPDSG